MVKLNDSVKSPRDKVTKTPIKSKTPMKAKTPTKGKSPMKVETPMKVKTPKKVETPMKVKTPKKVDTPMKVKTPKKVDTPMKVKTPKKVETPMEVETPMKVKTPKKAKTPMKAEIPMNLETPIKVNTPKSIKKQAKSSNTPSQKIPTPTKNVDSPKTPKEQQSSKKIENSKPSKTPKVKPAHKVETTGSEAKKGKTPQENGTENAMKKQEKTTVNNKRKREEDSVADSDVPAAKKYSGDPKVLYVGKLNSLTSKETLKKHFDQYGTVTVRIPHDSEIANKNKGYAFVTFETEEEAQKALKIKHTIDRRSVIVKPSDGSAARKERKETSKKAIPNQLYVSNLNHVTHVTSIKKHFEKYGTVHVVLPKGNGKENRGYAFVGFSTKQQMHRALADTEHKIDDWELKVAASSEGALQLKSDRDHTILNKLFVRNISWTTSVTAIEEHFAKYGDVQVQLPAGKGHAHKGFGFVSFGSTEAMESALACTEHVIDSRKLFIRRSVEKSVLERDIATTKVAEAENEEESDDEDQEEEEVDEQGDDEEEDDDDEEEGDDEEEEGDDEEEDGVDGDEVMEDDSDEDE